MQSKVSEEKKHAKFAASNSERWLSCPGSVQLSEGMPTLPTSAAAIEGTAAHSIMDFCLNARVRNVGTVYKVDEVIDVEGTEVSVTEEMIEGVQKYVDFVEDQSQKHHELLIEEEISLEFIDEEMFGTVDTSVVEPFGLLHVIDFKYGKKFVDPKKNSQMAYYALGIAHKNHYDFESVKTTIFQPRYGEGEPRSHTYTVPELKEWAEVFREGVRVAKSKNPPLKEGSWCWFCPAKVKCPQISKNSLSKAQLDFGKAIQPAPKSLTSDQLKTLLDKSAYLKLWIKEVEAHAELRIRAGEKIAGWGLAPKLSRRQWVNTTFEWPWYKSHAVSWSTLETKSVAQIEKELKALKVPKELMQKFFKDNTVAVSSGDKLSQTNQTDFVDFALETEIEEL